MRLVEPGAVESSCPPDSAADVPPAEKREPLAAATDQSIHWGAHLQRAYALIEAVRQDRRGRFFGAVVQSVVRHGIRRRLPDVAAAAATVGAAAASGHPVIGGIMGTVLFLSRTVGEVWRRRRAGIRASTHQDSRETQMVLARAFAAKPSSTVLAAPVEAYPDTQEFGVLWIQHAWELVRCLMGYNLRNEIARACLRDPARTERESDAATEILILLGWVREPLLAIRKILDDLFEAEKIGNGSLLALARSNDHLLRLNPFGSGDPARLPLDWLPLESPVLISADLPELAEQDLLAFDSGQEVGRDVVAENIGKAEAEHGAAVDEFLAARQRREAERRRADQAAGEASSVRVRRRGPESDSEDD